jgi:hypothetical protein
MPKYDGPEVDVDVSGVNWGNLLIGAILGLVAGVLLGVFVF